jgi:hypothetical protein
MPGIPMGPWPLNVTIINHDTASVLVDESTGMLWWKKEKFTEKRAFANASGNWFWRRSGNQVFGHCERRLDAAWRVYTREQTEKARKAVGG